jgi:membrane-associated phospholipid phosphatase
MMLVGSRLILGIAAFGALLSASYYWIDRPVSYFAHEMLGDYRYIFDLASRLPKLLAPIVVGGLFFVAVRIAARKSVGERQTAFVLSALSLGLSAIPENWLKFAFGRTWPETWVQNNPSLLRDGVSGFNWFHGGAGYASFPSGHMTAVCAILSIFWFLQPRYRFIYAVMIVTTFVGLLGANYHFVSDLIAGGLLGFSIGCIVISLWNSGVHPLRSLTRATDHTSPAKQTIVAAD